MHAQQKLVLFHFLKYLCISWASHCCGQMPEKKPIQEGRVFWGSWFVESVGAMAGAALGRGSRSGWVPAHIWAGQEAKKRNRGPLLAAGLCWLSLSALLFWGEPLSGRVSLLSYTLADTPSLLGDSKPSR